MHEGHLAVDELGAEDLARPFQLARDLVGVERGVVQSLRERLGALALVARPVTDRPMVGDDLPGPGGVGFASPPGVCTAQTNGTLLNDQDAYTASQGISAAP